MKLLVISAFVLIWSAAAAVADTSPTDDNAAPSGTPRMAADFSERDITGVHTIHLNSYRGKVILLNFWGPWCQPCRTEVPALERVQDEYKGRLVVIGAAVFSSDQAVELFYKDFAINYPVIYGSYDLMEKYGRVSAFPTTIVIDQKGDIVGTLVGSRTRDQFEEILKPLLAD